ncbi:hypothetical protein BH23ACT10_BH23ACT10_10580 [soil metagenome]
MSDQWAFCDRCDRWFYAEQAAVDRDQVRCPVCDASPSALHDQPLQPAALTA